MEPLMKKRIKALLIDSLVSSAASLTVEGVFRAATKNKKNVGTEFCYNVVLPTVTFWGLEYIQLRRSGQTVGHKLQGIMIESEDGTALTDEQIVKRLIHRDSVSTFAYLKDRTSFDGSRLPHDLYAGTVLKEQ